MALKTCAQPGCATLIARGRTRCPAHERQVEEQRGTASSRGYTKAWERFCRWFMEELVNVGIPPECGATLPGGPVTSNSQCKAEGRHTHTSADGSSLHRNHAPELTDAERVIPALVMDPKRIELLCRECHTAATWAETSRPVPCQQRGALEPRHKNSYGNLENAKTHAESQDERSISRAGCVNPSTALTVAFRMPGGGVSLLPLSAPETDRAAEKARCAHRCKNLGAVLYLSGGLDFSPGRSTRDRARAND